ncbi:MAG: hypothetical protein IJH65_03315 [Methanobrevibacter sp.]|nr:hypothetical protein [Methanobrevibacter sp.]
MKYKFNESNNITGFIKELLYNFNLPTYEVYKDGKELIEGRSYIKDINIFKYSKGKLDNIAPFEYGRKILNSTTNLKMNSSIYDTYTHEYLGRYLRFLKNYRGLDLMSLYNCFSYNRALELEYSLPIMNDSNEVINHIVLSTSDTHYNYYLIPVIFDQEYTIAIDSFIPYELCTLIYTGNKLLDISKTLIKESYQKVPGSKFSAPYIYKTVASTGDKDYWKYEENARLLLKLPKKIDSSIVILEGNYLSCANICGGVLTPYYIINKEDLDDKPSRNITPPTRLSLLEVNNGISYPFADRLVEYLLNNAITPLDEISENIKRTQDAAYQNRVFKGIYGR